MRIFLGSKGRAAAWFLVSRGPSKKLHAEEGRAGRGMAQAMPRPLPVFGPLGVLFGGHAAAWVAYAAALKGFWDFEILGLGI